MRVIGEDDAKAWWRTAKDIPRLLKGVITIT
jgi:hypothetical protein